MFRTFPSLSLSLSLILLFFPILYKQGNSASPLLNLRCFFPFSVYLVSEFLVVFPARSFLYLSPTLLFTPSCIRIRICATPSICARARASRVIISIHDCDANFYCFLSRRPTLLPPNSLFFFSCFLTRFVPCSCSFLLFVSRNASYFISHVCVVIRECFASSSLWHYWSKDLEKYRSKLINVRVLDIQIIINMI